MSVARALSVLEKKSGKWRVIPLEHIRNNNRRYYCDVCCAYLTHDSAPGRKQHNRGFKHRENVQRYYDQFKPEFYAKLQANHVAAQMAGNMQQHQQPMPHNTLIPPGQDGPVRLPPHMQQDMAPPPFAHSGIAPPHSGMPPRPPILPPMEGLQAGQPPPMFNAPAPQKEPLKGENGVSQQGGGEGGGSIGLAPPMVPPTTQGASGMPPALPSWLNPNDAAPPQPSQMIG